MSDSHNDDPFAPPPQPPAPLPFPERVDRVERFGEIAPAERFGEIPVEAYVPAPPPVEPLPAVTFGEGGYAPPSGMTLAPADAIPGDPAVAATAATVEPRLALDGTSLWLNRLGEELVAWLKTLASAAVYATLIVTFGFQVARVEGMSMAPTLQDQDRLIVNKLAYRIGDPKVGDIVMLYYPLKPEKSFVKRNIAEEGDQVRIVDGKVFRNDVQLDDSFVPADYRSHDDWGPQVIPEGYYFVMGDHRNNSSDSRHWGFVPKKYIIGKVQLRWWPMGHAKVF